MTKVAQNVGTDATNPVVRGSKAVLVFNVTPLVTAEVDSASYSFLDAPPGTPGADVLFTKATGGSGISFADGSPSGVDFTVTIDKADLDTLFAAEYYHQLTVVKTNSDDVVVSTGTFKLTAGAPALIT